MVLKNFQTLNTDKRRDLLLALIAFVVALALWQMQGLFFLTYPLRLFVTLIHELGHGLAAIVTGGSFEHFNVTKSGAGVAYTTGGARVVIIQAGYLGTALFGAVLLYLTNKVRQPGRIAVVLGILIGGLTLFFAGIKLSNLSWLETVASAAVIAVGLYLFLTRDTNQGRYTGLAITLAGVVILLMLSTWGDIMLTVMVGLGSGLFLIWIGLRASRDIVLVILNFLAFMTGLQAITDSWILFRITSMPRSMMPLNDAANMAHTAGGSATLWALIWIALDILFFGSAVYFTFVKPMRQKQIA
jgi:hypothetical protein